MQCPNCGLENPPSSETCDCGYSFVKGLYVPTQPNRTALIGVPDTGRYSALRSISRIYGASALLIACTLVVAGIVILINSSEQQKAIAIGTAIGCFSAAAVQWLIFRGVAEAITLLVDIANDVHAIAAKAYSATAR